MDSALTYRLTGDNAMDAHESNADLAQGIGGLAGESPLLPIAPGPTTILSSSLALKWRGIVLETHLTQPGQRKDVSTDHHVISMINGAPPRFDYRVLAGEFIACVSRPGAIMVTPAGSVPDMRLHTCSEFVHCAIENSSVLEAKEDCGYVPGIPVFRPALENKSIQRIIALLVEELETPRPSGRLYVEALAQVLASRYVRLDSGARGRPEPRPRGLLPRILNRVRDKIEANLDADLTLGSLAEESGYSRAHFLRMFRAATGVTPHQYVLDLRLRRAQERLMKTNSSIIDIAVSCGFSSQSHMTSVFRQRLETTPAEFRRNV